MRWLSKSVDLNCISHELDHVPKHTLTPEQYWHRLHPRLRGFGISRVADIMGLDFIGLPVVQAVRPMALSNAVTQGKARTMSGAAVGAVLECLEMAAGENLERFDVVSALELEMWGQLAPGLPTGMVWPTAKSAYVPAWNLSIDTLSAVPRDLISTDFSIDAPAAEAPILRHSIGLGAGTTLGSAMMHGLLESIEADARIRSETFGGEQRLALKANDPIYGWLIELTQGQGLRAAVFDLPCQGGVQAVKASIMEPVGATSLPLPAVGYAARPNHSDAIAAALAEALQARLAVISGAREDITQRFYSHGFERAELEAEWERHVESSSTIVQVSADAPTLGEISEKVGPVFAVPLHWDPELPLAITRIIAPNLIADPLRLVASSLDLGRLEPL